MGGEPTITIGRTNALLTDGWAYAFYSYSGQNAQLHDALIHTCGLPSEKELTTSRIPLRNLNTEWQILSDENWTEVHERLPGCDLQPLRQ